MKIQGVVTPDGVCVDLFGPKLGAMHDTYLLNESGLLRRFEDNMKGADGNAYCLYGDPAYGMSAHICCLYSESEGPLAEDMLPFNKEHEWLPHHG